MYHQNGNQKNAHIHQKNGDPNYNVHQNASVCKYAMAHLHQAASLLEAGSQ
jgi:hypothetical protein